MHVLFSASTVERATRFPFEEDKTDLSHKSETIKETDTKLGNSVNAGKESHRAEMGNVIDPLESDW
jgi:hypothetical protein